MPDLQANTEAMSSSPAPPDTVAALPSLAEFRREIDRVDDALHDLLMQRAELVERVGRLRKAAYRPGREASVIRRLLARHAGPLPRRAVARLWREVFAAHIAIETQFAIAVCDVGETGTYAAVAREHFGALTPLRIHRSAIQAMTEVANGTATAAVLPLPVEEEPVAAAWWVPLLHREMPRIHVVARLPFWASPRPAGGGSAQALALAVAAPDPSGRDRSLLGLEVPGDTSRARLAARLGEAGLVARDILLRRDPSGGPARGLVHLEGYLTEDDPRLRAITAHRPVLLGGYAVPIEADEA
jgi:chorismate mutase/prephenate dehydratase